MLARGGGGERRSEGGEVGGDDSGEHCGVRRIQGSKSDYQLVSEARLRCSLAFTATFYVRWLDNDPALQGPRGPRRSAKSCPPPPLKCQHPRTATQREENTTPVQCGSQEVKSQLLKSSFGAESFNHFNRRVIYSTDPSKAKLGTRRIINQT